MAQQDIVKTPETLSENSIDNSQKPPLFPTIKKSSVVWKALRIFPV
jgi:hypothetical protein